MTFIVSPNTRQRIAESASREELLEFGDWLETERYTPFVCDQHLRRLVFVLPRLSREGGTRIHTDAQLKQAFGPERSPKSRLYRFAATRRAYRRFLLAQGRLRAKQARDRFSSIRQRYADYLVDLRGLSLSARQHHAQEVADFLTRGLRPRQQIRSLSRSDVERFIFIRSREISRNSLQHTVGILRSFLRYLLHAGYIGAPLDSLDTPRTYRGELPPRALPWSAVGALLASIDPHSKAGWRDLCILHLIAYYGLRPSEVVDLRVDSIDWDAKVLRVHQRKTRSDLKLPLASPTIQLLHKYLAHSRNDQGATHDELFLRARCPYGPLERCGVNNLYHKRVRESGLALSGSSVYSLRHTFAMRLLTRGVGVKAIGDVLGHRSLESTCAYLRLDIGMLRGVALAVPRPSNNRGARHGSR